jgi:ribosomal protein S14
VSREYLFSFVVSDHDPARADAIAAAVASWLNEGASGKLPVRRTDTDGALALEFHVGMGGGWKATHYAKSVAFRVGQANGRTCRVKWASWLLDEEQFSLDWPIDRTDDRSTGDAPTSNREIGGLLADEGDAHGASGPEAEVQIETPGAALDQEAASGPEASARARRFFVRTTVSGPSDPTAVLGWLRRVEVWTEDPSGYGGDSDTFIEAAFVLPAGLTLRARAESWLAALETGYGNRVGLWLSAWDLDQPTEARIFETGCFPIQEPERLIRPEDLLLSFGRALGVGPDRCGYCDGNQGLHRLDRWALPEIREFVEETIARRSLYEGIASHAVRRANPAICRSCLTTILKRLAVANGIVSGVFETDGNPFGLTGRPDLPCITCGTPATEEVVVLNHDLAFWVCRSCLRRAASELEAAGARAAQRRTTRRRRQRA